MIELKNCTFDAQGENVKDKVFGLNLNGTEDALIEDCKFASKGYSAIFLNTTGKVDIKNCEFDCANNYNPVEGGSSASNAKLSEVNISDCKFSGICGNNYMNFYNMEDGAKISISNVKIEGMSQQAECIRLSNLANSNMDLNINGLDYTYDMTTAFDENWTKMILCQDYTKDGIQDFRKFNINIKGVKCNGTEVHDKDSFPIGGLICIYDANMSFDGVSQYPEGNMPNITME